MAQAGHMPITDCPVARMAHEAAAILIQSSPEDAGLLDRTDALGDAAGYLAARSPLGVYYQALLALTDASPEALWFEDNPASQKAARRLERLLTSIAVATAAQAHPPTVAALSAYYLPRRAASLIQGGAHV